jgi:hypothetical protein
MTSKLFFGFSLFLIIISSSCKEEDPFEYPEDPEQVDPTWITEMEREVTSDEGWTPVQFSAGCDPNLSISNLAAYELNYTRGFAILRLLPNDSNCTVRVSVETEFKTNEISNYDWEELHFEYTYSEYSGEPDSKYMISLNYGNLELDLDLAPIIADLIPADTTDGLLHLSFEDQSPVFELNGKEFTPDFSSESGNFISLDGAGTDSYFKVSLVSENTDQATYTAFQYLRITRFGFEES